MPTRFLNNGGVESGGIFMGKKVVFKDPENEKENGVLKKSSIYNVHKFSDESSSSSSSIGKDSDLSENSMGKSCDDDEVQSSHSKGALDAMEALEEVLPIRRGISCFYNGKSKSYASLAYASPSSSSSCSTKDIGKPENPYTRKRRNQLSCALHWDKNRASFLKTKTKTTLALGLAMSSSDGGKKDGECINSGGSSLLSSSSSMRSSDFSPWRSFSLTDLQRGITAANTCSGLDSNI